MDNVPGIGENGAVGLAAWTGESRGMASAHRHLDLEINFVLSGTMRYLVGGGMVEVPPRRLCLLWAGVPHQMIRNSRLEMVEAIWVTVPLAALLRWGLPDRLIRPLLATGFLADPAPRPGDEAMLQQWVSDLPGYDKQRQRAVVALGNRETAKSTAEIVLLEIEARLRRFALALEGPGREATAEESFATHRENPETGTSAGIVAAHSDRGLAAVEAMAQFVARKFQDEIGIAEIADAAHLHPNYAMTVFRQHTGMTLSRYLTLQRVAHAQRLLATTSNPIPQIALDSGFGSVSRFYEAFRQQTGSTPRRFRLHIEFAPPPV